MELQKKKVNEYSGENLYSLMSLIFIGLYIVYMEFGPTIIYKLYIG